VNIRLERINASSLGGGIVLRITGERISKEDEDRMHAWHTLINLKPEIYKAKLKKDTYEIEIPGLPSPIAN